MIVASWALLLVLLLLVVAVTVRAAEEEVAEPAVPQEDEADAAPAEAEADADAEAAAAAAQAEMEAQMRQMYPRMSDEVVVTSVFPDSPEERKFVAGDIVEVVMGFENRGELPMTIRSLQAHLMNPYDFSQILQNYSRLGDETVVQPNEQASVLYRFRSDPTTEAREYGLTGIVFYEDSEGQQYYHAYYNHTIELTEAEFEMESQQYVLSIVVVALTAAVVRQIGFNAPEDKKAKKKSAAAAAAPKGKGKGKGSSDWLAHTAAAKR